MTRTQIARIGVAGVFITLLAAASVWGTYRFFTTRFPGGNDMIPRHVGAHAWLFDGLSPYDPAVSQRGQRLIYGRLADDAGEDKAHFTHPFYVILFYLPTAPLPFELSRAVWMVVLELCMVALAVLSVRLYDWQPPPVILAALVLFAALWYHGARVILLGQFAGLSAALIVVGLWAVKRRRDALAGIVLALATAKPNMLFLLWPLLFAWSLAARRLRMAAWMGGALAALLAFSWLSVPTWLPDMWAQIVSYQSYTDIGSPINSLTREIVPGLGAAGELALTALAMGWLLFAWWRRRRIDSDQVEWDWAVALTLVITNLVAPRTATTNYVMMLPALILLLRWAATNRGSSGLIYGAVVLVVLFAGLWWLFLITVEGRVEQVETYLPLPFGLALGLLAARPGQRQAGPEPVA